MRLRKILRTTYKQITQHLACKITLHLEHQRELNC